MTQSFVGEFEFLRRMKKTLNEFKQRGDIGFTFSDKDASCTEYTPWGLAMGQGTHPFQK